MAPLFLPSNVRLALKISSRINAPIYFSPPSATLKTNGGKRCRQVQKNFADYLGGIRYDEKGKIVGAQATVIRWFGKMNATDALLNPAVERNEPIDQVSMSLNFLPFRCPHSRVGSRSYPQPLD